MNFCIGIGTIKQSYVYDKVMDDLFIKSHLKLANHREFIQKQISKRNQIFINKLVCLHLNIIRFFLIIIFYLKNKMSKRSSNRTIKETPKYQELKKSIDQQLKNPVRNKRNPSVKQKKKNFSISIKEQKILNQDKIQNKNPVIQNNQQKLDVPQKQDLPQQGQFHTKSQIKKLVSISSENFVMCKLTDFENDYQLIDKIGQGSFGSVFRIKHRVLKIDRALKKIKKNPTSQFSSLQEIEVLKKLDHSNILKIYEFYQSDDCYMIVTEIFEGRQLFDQIVNQEKMNEQIASKIIREILLTLNYTHAMNIAHRDIKPQNILIRNISDKNNFKIKIIDWGLGTLIRQQFSDRVCGTPQYAAPQIFQGKYSLSCDMWSLGVLTFVMLTGNMPFKGTNTQETISQVKRSIINYRKTGFKDLSQKGKQFITSLVQKDITKRMTAAQALQHPWIKQHYEAKVEPQFFKQTLMRLKELNISNHFGVAVVNLMNNHFSSSEQKDKLQEIFKFLDANGDGVLSSSELIQGYSKIYGRDVAQKIAEETFKKLDVNNSGTLQYSQFIAYGLRRERQKQKQKLKQAFDMFDQDKNGSISWKQVGNILEGKLQGLYEEDMKRILMEVDQNKDNEITFEQFYKFMGTLFEKVDTIRESKKKQSQIKSVGSKKEQEPITKQLKRTESISQPVQAQKKEQKQQKSLLNPIRKKRK